jgi:hypothetical protein
MFQLKSAVLLAASLGLALLGAAKIAEASPITITDSPTGPISGAVYDNLNTTTASPIVSFTGSANYVTGLSAYNYAPPVLSNGNGTMFGNSNGTDTSRYIAVEGGGSAKFLFGATQTYFGLLWGSVDSFNTLSFYDNSTLIGAVTGSAVTSSANGDRTASGTLYVNINSTLPFNTVIASSTANSFEFDNVAYKATPTAVPEPTSLMMFGTGLGLLGLILWRRRLPNRLPL